MLRMTILATAAVVGALLGTPALAASLQVYNTGVDAGGNVLPDGTLGDPHYTLIQVPAVGSGSTAQTRVITSASGFPIPPYVGDNALSRWIGPNNDSDLNGPPGDYIYRSTLTIAAGYDPDSVVLSGLWASDNNAVDILVNGSSTGNSIPWQSGGNLPTDYSFGHFTPFSITQDLFQIGVNFIDFVVHNGRNDENNPNDVSNNPTGLRVQYEVARIDVPEPASMALFAMGGIGLLGLRRRRQTS